MRQRAGVVLPVVLSLAVVAVVVAARTSDRVAALLLIVGAVVAIGVFDVLVLRAAHRESGAQTHAGDQPDGGGSPTPPSRR